MRNTNVIKKKKKSDGGRQTLFLTKFNFATVPDFHRSKNRFVYCVTPPVRCWNQIKPDQLTVTNWLRKGGTELICYFHLGDVVGAYSLIKSPPNPVLKATLELEFGKRGRQRDGDELC